MTERDRRALVLGGGVVLTAVLLLRVLPWTVRSALAAEAGLRERAALLARARADLADAAVLRDSAVGLGQALVDLAPKILSGNTAAEAVSDLSGRVNLAVGGHQAKLERVDAVADSGLAGRLHRATLRAAFECDVRGLAGVLQALEFGKTALSVRELRVTAIDAASIDKNPEVLRVEMDGDGVVPGERRRGKREGGRGPMTATQVNASLVVAGSFGLAMGVRLVAAPLVRVTVPPRVGIAPPTATAAPAGHPDSLVAAFLGRDPFRVARRPSDVVYDPVRLAQPAAPPLPKPALALVGIVWDSGRDPTALVEGLPGADGPRPVRQGETVGGLRVKTIKPDRVVITGLDTTWTLTVREPWR